MKDHSPVGPSLILAQWNFLSPQWSHNHHFFSSVPPFLPPPSSPSSLFFSLFLPLSPPPPNSCMGARGDTSDILPLQPSSISLNLKLTLPARTASPGDLPASPASVLGFQTHSGGTGLSYMRAGICTVFLSFAPRAVVAFREAAAFEWSMFL